LCQRIDSRLVNKRVLESLIKCGALDSFTLPRAQMVVGLEKTLELAAKTQKEQASGQLSFFGHDSKENGLKENPNNLPRVNEWPEPQLLAFEKEMLGFYVSGHPLARYAQNLKRFASSTTDLSQRSDNEEIKIVGLIVKIKQTTTRVKQEKMAILKLEDLEGAVEVLVFPQAFAKVSRCLQLNTVVMVRGRLNLKEDTPKIIANDLFPIEQIYKLIIALNINLSGLRENLFQSLKELLTNYPGSIPIYLHLVTPKKSKVQVVVDEGLYVEPSEKLIQEIENILGEERVTLVI